MASPTNIRLKRIRVYPLKGAGGLDLSETRPDSFGIPGDRRWMLVKPDGLFISQRTHPRLSLVRVRPLGPEGKGPVGDRESQDAWAGPVGGGGPSGEASDGGAGAPGAGSGESSGLYSAEIPGKDPVTLCPPETPDWLDVQVHRDRFPAMAGYGDVDHRFSAFLGEPCKLVHIPDEVHRPVDPAWAPGHRVSLADGYPILLTTEESLGDLNQRSSTTSSMLRFRPNLVVEGGSPWEEDLWRSVRIGDARLDLVKPCARCSVVSVDPGTGNRGADPLKTLRTFRAWEGKVYFGQNAVFANRGSLEVGDDVHVLERGVRRPPLPTASAG